MALRRSLSSILDHLNFGPSGSKRTDLRKMIRMIYYSGQELNMGIAVHSDKNALVISRQGPNYMNIWCEIAGHNTKNKIVIYPYTIEKNTSNWQEMNAIATLWSVSDAIKFASIYTILIGELRAGRKQPVPRKKKSD